MANVAGHETNGPDVDPKFLTPEGWVAERGLAMGLQDRVEFPVGSVTLKMDSHKYAVLASTNGHASHHGDIIDARITFVEQVVEAHDYYANDTYAEVMKEFQELERKHAA